MYTRVMKPASSSKRELWVVASLLSLIAVLGFVALRPAPAPIIPALEKTTVTVTIAGEVKTPGAYTLPFGSRVAALVAAAGGYNAQAEPSLVNPVQILTDGDQVRVPSKFAAQTLNTPPKTGSSKTPAGRVNVNTASPSELEALPGVGPKMAARIVAGRPFASMADLDKISGIGPSILKKLEPFVKF